MSVFLDDIKILTPKRKNFIGKVKAKLTAIFLIVDIGFISFHLSLKIIQD